MQFRINSQVIPAFAGATHIQELKMFTIDSFEIDWNIGLISIHICHFDN